MSIRLSQLQRMMIALFAVGLLAVWPGVTHAMTAGDLEVQFAGGSTLFGTDAAIAPGFVDTKTVTVTNHGSHTETVYTKPVNYTSSGLASAMTLAISATSTGKVYFNDRFDRFFSPAPVMLGQLAPHTARTYTFQAGFASSTGDAYEHTSMSFDLAIGFAGGPSVVTPSTGGGGGGIIPGGGYIRHFNTPTTTPPGQVLGASTTRSYPAFFTTLGKHFTASPVGQVLGAHTTSAASATPVASTTPVIAPGGTVSTTTAATTTTTDAVCTLVWLFCFFLISATWTFYHDLLRRQSPVQSRLFGFNILAQGGFLLILAGLWLSHGLPAWQWVPLAWWIMFVTFDSVWHHRLQLDPTARRFFYYGLTSLVFILLSLLVGVPCIWWPFAVLLFVSIGLWRWPRQSHDSVASTMSTD